MDNARLLCDIGELNHLFRDSVDVESLLQRTVEMVASHMKADVCSIYTYDEDDQLLILRATRGLNIRAIGDVCMKLSEGLTGKSLKELRAIRVSGASGHPEYKYFAGTDEERFENFLAVPIVRGLTRIGVLVLQRIAKDVFTDEDELTCKAVASQLANIIENAKFLMAMHVPAEHKAKPPQVSELKFVHGKVASEGYAYAEARVVDRDGRFAQLLEREFSRELSSADFDRAVESTTQQLETMQKRVEEQLDDAGSLIFASHLLVLKDKEFTGLMRRMITDGVGPAEAVLKVAQEYIAAFTRSSNAYFREKVQDVEDLVVRLMGNMAGDAEELAGHSGCIVVARELFPSDLLRMSSEDVAGIVLVGGGITSHLSILTRSLRIPMVIANEPRLTELRHGASVLIDGRTGNVYVEPTDEVVRRFEQQNRSSAAVKETALHTKPRTILADGTEVLLMANINLLGDLQIARDVKCAGIGLYRTEFPFIIRNSFPSEQEQYFTYKKLIDGLDHKPVTFRTLDIGGDKVLGYYYQAHEQNPAMGMRSIRFSLRNREIFAQQIRAILRAGAGSEIRIMFPMISSLEDFLAAKGVVLSCVEELEAKKTEHNNKPALGMMVELPAVLNLIDSFVAEVDFLSIGTNDLIQFMLGADRTNENVEDFYIPHHPSVLRAIAAIVRVARKEGVDVSVCGDMARHAAYVRWLVGIGIRTLSLDPANIPGIQRVIEQMNVGEAQRLAEKVLAETRIDAIEELLGIRDAPTD